MTYSITDSFNWKLSSLERCKTGTERETELIYYTIKINSNCKLKINLN